MDTRRAVAARIHGREFTAHHVGLVSWDGVGHHQQFGTWAVVREHRVRQGVRIAAFSAVARRHAERWSGVVLHLNDLLCRAFVAAIVCGREGAHNGERVGARVQTGDGVHLHGDVRIRTRVCGHRVSVHDFLVAFDREAGWNSQLRSRVVHQQHTLLILRHVAAFVHSCVQAQVSAYRLDASTADFNVFPCQCHVSAVVRHRHVGRIHVKFGAFKLKLQISFEGGRCGVFDDEVSCDGAAVAAGVGRGEDHRPAAGGCTNRGNVDFFMAPLGHAAGICGRGPGVVVQPGLVLGQVACPVAFHGRICCTVNDRGGGVDDLNGLGLWTRAVAAVVHRCEGAGHRVFVLARTGNGVGDFGDGHDAARFVDRRHLQGMIRIALGRVVGREGHKFELRQEIDCDGLHADSGVGAGVGGREGACHHVLAIKKCGVGFGDKSHVAAIVEGLGLHHGVVAAAFSSVALRNNQGWCLFIRHDDRLGCGGLVVAIVRRRPSAVQHELVVAERIHRIHSQCDGDVVVGLVDGRRVFQHHLGGAVVEGVQRDKIEDRWRDIFQADDDLSRASVATGVGEGVRPNERGRFLVKVGVRLQRATA